MSTMSNPHSVTDCDLEVTEITKAAEHIQVIDDGDDDDDEADDSNISCSSNPINNDSFDEEVMSSTLQSNSVHTKMTASTEEEEEQQHVLDEEESITKSPVPIPTNYSPVQKISRGRGINSPWSIHSNNSVIGRGRGGTPIIPHEPVNDDVSEASNGYHNRDNGPPVKRTSMDELQKEREKSNHHNERSHQYERKHHHERSQQFERNHQIQRHHDRDHTFDRNHHQSQHNSRGNFNRPNYNNYNNHQHLPKNFDTPNQFHERRRVNQDTNHDNNHSTSDVQDPNNETTLDPPVENNVEGAKEKPREIYVPEEEPTGDEMFRGRTERYRTGLNFDAYENIPVQVEGDLKKTYNIKTFEDLGYNDILLENLVKIQYKKPTPIQKSASPFIRDGIDVMSCAQTGSGKTAAFLLPVLNDLLLEQISGSRNPYCLILTPTRELAKQIQNEANLYSYNTGIVSCCAYGGVAPFHQKKLLRKGVDILIATPGRLLQFLHEKVINLEYIKYFILDEADIMMDMGFMPDVRRIIFQMPEKKRRVSAMFSATFPSEIQKAAKEYLRNYVFVAIGTVGGACSDIKQIIYRVDKADKRKKLREVFEDISENEKVLIFCGKKQNVDFLAAHLSTLKIKATSIHGDRLQSQRELALKEFIEGTRQVLVATSVAARGLDIPKVSVVINYELPEDIDEYIHRIGRTGRVGNTGKSISFFDPYNDVQLASKLVSTLRNANQEIPDWLAKLSSHDESASFRSNPHRFGATDHRRFNRVVPEPVENIDDDEDDWS